MINLLELGMRNFLSYGNNITRLRLDTDEAYLIVGRNYDSIVNGEVDSNGSGKTTILNAISFCLYDKTISSIDKSDLINYINEKNLEVYVIFQKNEGFYKVERYRKNKTKGGDGVRLFFNAKEPVFADEHDKTPDSVSNANMEVEKLLGMPFEIFSRIVVYSATFEPFLNLPATHQSKANQKDILDELFGYTEISQKAEKLKDTIKNNKADYTNLMTRVTMLEEEAARIQAQIESTTQKSQDWEAQHKLNKNGVKAELKQLLQFDYDKHTEACLANTETKVKIQELKSQIQLLKLKLDQAVEVKRKKQAWETNREREIEQLNGQLGQASLIDIDSVAAALEEAKTLTAESRQLEGGITALEMSLSSARALLADLQAQLSNAINDIEKLESATCPYCNQHFADYQKELHACNNKKASTEEAMVEVKANIEKDSAELDALKEKKIDIEKKKKLNSIKTQGFTEVSLQKLVSSLDAVVEEIEKKTNSKNPFEVDPNAFVYEAELMQLNEELNQCIDSLVEEEYTLKEINEKVSKRDLLEDKFLSMQNESNPFLQFVDELRAMMDKVDKPDYTKLNDLDQIIKHQEFLYKLLSKKDSYIRKALINKHVPFLNSRLSYYLKKIGLVHMVSFMEDMSVKITNYGKTYPFQNLSSGQKARVNLALAFAFRDVLQQRYQRINFCILDECLDTGLGNVGVQLAARMVREVASENNMTMFVISHKDEISSMFDHKIEIELRNQFSTIVSGPVIQDEE